MNEHDRDDLGGRSMLDLFRVEAEAQTAMLTHGLLELERAPATPQTYATLMRAAHSLKGAARIVDLQGAVRVAHALEDCFVAAQHHKRPCASKKSTCSSAALICSGNCANRLKPRLPPGKPAMRPGIHQFVDALALLIPDREAGGGAPVRREYFLSQRRPDRRHQLAPLFQSASEARTRPSRGEPWLRQSRKPNFHSKPRPMPSPFGNPSRPNASCDSPPRTSIVCSPWRANPWSNRAGSGPSPIHSTALNTIKPAWPNSSISSIGLWTITRCPSARRSLQ